MPRTVLVAASLVLVASSTFIGVSSAVSGGQGPQIRSNLPVAALPAVAMAESDAAEIRSLIGEFLGTPRPCPRTSTASKPGGANVGASRHRVRDPGYLAWRRTSPETIFARCGVTDTCWLHCPVSRLNGTLQKILRNGWTLAKPPGELMMS